MILLDTDHVTLLKYPESERGGRLVKRLEAILSGEALCISVITVEEQMRRWMAAVAKERLAKRQVFAYRELANLFDFFANFTIVIFDELAADNFDRLRSTKIRIGTMDLKIASIALAKGAILLSANKRDFERVPDLRVENWLE